MRGTQALNGWPGWRWKMSLCDRISSWGTQESSRRRRKEGRKEGEGNGGEEKKRKRAADLSRVQISCMMYVPS